MVSEHKPRTCKTVCTEGPALTAALQRTCLLMRQREPVGRLGPPLPTTCPVCAPAWPGPRPLWTHPVLLEEVMVGGGGGRDPGSPSVQSMRPGVLRVKEVPAVCSCLSPALGVNSDLQGSGGRQNCLHRLSAVQWEHRWQFPSGGQSPRLGRHGEVWHRLGRAQRGGSLLEMRCVMASGVAVAVIVIVSSGRRCDGQVWAPPPLPGPPRPALSQGAPNTHICAERIQGRKPG